MNARALHVITLFCARARDVPSKLVLARRARQMKLKERKKIEKAEKLAEDKKKQGTFGMTKHAITRREKRAARKSAAAASYSEAEAAVLEEMVDCDGAVPNEDIDRLAIASMGLVEAEHATKEAEKKAEAKKKKKLDDAKELMKAQLEEFERNDQPRRRVASTALLESIQNSITIQGSKSKAKVKPKAAKGKAAKPKASKGKAANKKPAKKAKHYM